MGLTLYDKHFGLVDIGQKSRRRIHSGKGERERERQSLKLHNHQHPWYFFLCVIPEIQDFLTLEGGKGSLSFTCTFIL